MMALEYGEDILVIDAGLMFPDDFMPGVDLVIPDFGYLRERKDHVRWLVLTHGHEDHIGAIPFFLREFDLPVTGTGFTLELLREKLKEHGLLQSARLRKVQAGDRERFGPFEVEFIRVNHSTVDGVGLAIDTPEGIIVHSGDFRIDPTPVDGQPTDLNRFAHYGEQGVLAFLSDSTNAEKEGFTLSERLVTRTLEELFQECRGRIILAAFASNITRIQQMINLAARFNRKVLFSGKSMITNVGIAQREGYLQIPDGLEIRERAVEQFPDHGVAIITTGSQGEPMSALARMAQGKHKNVRIRSGDTIILSSRFIPGNERAITGIINRLYRMGADVIYEKVSDIHTSGHAKQEELKLLLSLVRPRFFIPIHGEYRHLVKHAQLARETGIPEERILLAENGTVICFEKGCMETREAVPTGRVLVDGKGVGDVGEAILRERMRLSEDGVVVVHLSVDERRGGVIDGPRILSRGFVFEDERGSLLEDVKGIVLEVADEMKALPAPDWRSAEAEIERRLKRFFYKSIERRPLILPIIAAL